MHLVGVQVRKANTCVIISASGEQFPCYKPIIDSIQVTFIGVEKKLVTCWRKLASASRLALAKRKRRRLQFSYTLDVSLIGLMDAGVASRSGQFQMLATRLSSILNGSHSRSTISINQKARERVSAKTSQLSLQRFLLWRVQIKINTPTHPHTHHFPTLHCTLISGAVENSQ